MQLNKGEIEQYRDAVERLKLAAENHENKLFRPGLQYGSLQNRANNTPSSNGPDRPPNNKFHPF
jgi:hypothetical protein